jgi:hypothetical protein
MSAFMMSTFCFACASLRLQLLHLRFVDATIELEERRPRLTCTFGSTSTGGHERRLRSVA